MQSKDTVKYHQYVKQIYIPGGGEYVNTGDEAICDTSVADRVNDIYTLNM